MARIPQIQNLPARWLAICLPLILFTARPAGAQDIDALYLNDGTVLKGTIVRVADGDYLVYSSIGELGVEASRVLYAAERDSVPPVIAETHVFIGGTTETFTVFDKEVPPRSADATDGQAVFRFLAPGTVASIVNQEGHELPFTSRDVGQNSIVEIRQSAIPADTRRLQVTAWRFDLLKITAGGRLVFAQKYTPDREGTARVIVKYPKAWKIAEIAPAPDQQFPGLIVWKTSLNRQQHFHPRRGPKIKQ